MKFPDKIYFNNKFYLHLFQKHLGTFIRGSLLKGMSPNVYWPCRTSCFFNRPKVILGNFFSGPGPADHC